jgi:hypothetical protein
MALYQHRTGKTADNNLHVVKILVGVPRAQPLNDTEKDG